MTGCPPDWRLKHVPKLLDLFSQLVDFFKNFVKPIARTGLLWPYDVSSNNQFSHNNIISVEV